MHTYQLTNLPATIINSDMIPFERRGMYQAIQNVLYGFGSICGASLGGSIAESVGWRWCFLLQVPVSTLALVVGYKVVKNQFHSHLDSSEMTLLAVWNRVDLSGALLLILGLSSQLVGLSMGGNELPWNNPWVIGSLVASVIFLVLFVVVEGTTSALPVIPLRMLRGKSAVFTQLSNICVGMSAYAVCISRVVTNSTSDLTSKNSFSLCYRFSSRSSYLTQLLKPVRV